MNRSYIRQIRMLALIFSIAATLSQDAIGQASACQSSFLLIGNNGLVLPCGSMESSTPTEIINGLGASTLPSIPPSSCSSPNATQDVAWKLFGAEGGNWEWQIIGANGGLHYALYESQDNTCTGLLLVDCGTDFNTWQSVNVNPTGLRRYYIAIWADDPNAANVSFQINFRNGCGGCESLTDCCIAAGGTVSTVPIEACEGSPNLNLTLNPPSDGLISQLYDYRYYVVDRNGGASDGTIVFIDSMPNVALDLSDFNVTANSNYEICGISYLRADNGLSPQVGDSFDAVKTDLDSNSPSFCGSVSTNCTPLSILSSDNPGYTPIVDEFNAPSICGLCNGNIVFAGFQIGQSYTLFFDYNGNATSFGPTTPNSSGEIIISNLCAGELSNFIVRDISDCGVPITNISSAGLYPVGIENPTHNIVVQPSSCTSTDGRLEIKGLLASNVYRVFYEKDGIPQTYGPALANTLGTYTLFGLGSGSYDNFTILSASTNCQTNPLADTPFSMGDIPATPQVSQTINICEGSNLNFNVISPSNSPTGATWSWTGPNMYTSSDFEPSISNASASDAGTYTVILSENGCSSIPVTVEVNVNSTPSQPTLVASGGGCDDSPISLTTTASCSRYYWIPPGGSFTTAAITPLLNTLTSFTTIPASHGFYQGGDWTLICVENGCPSPTSLAQPISIGDVPAPPIPMMIGSACAGSDIELSVMNNYPPGTTINWYAADPSIGNPSPVSTLESLDFATIDAGNYTYWIQAEANNCFSNSSVYSFTITDIPSVAPSYTGGGCGEAVQLMANPTPNNPTGLIFAWTGSDGLMSSDQNPLINNPSATAVDYSVTITNNNGCSSTGSLTGIAASAQLSVVPLITSTTTSVCQGEMIQLSTAEYVGDDVSYFWAINGATNTTQTTLSPNLTIPNAFPSLHDANYTVQILDGACFSLPSQGVDISVLPTPTMPIINVNSGLCEGEELVLTSATIPNANYTWTGPNNWSSNLQNPSIPAVTTAAAGVYTLTVEVNGCMAPNATTTVAINSLPTMPQISNNSPICDGETLVLNVTNPDPNFTYSWYNQATSILVGTGAILEIQNISANAANDYYVILSSSTACNFTSPTIGVEVVAVGNLIANAGIDEIACADNYQLAATNVSTMSNQLGTWSVIEGSGSFSGANLFNAQVSNLSEGTNTFVWTVTHGICPVLAKDTVTISKPASPVLRTEEFMLNFGDTLVNIDVLENDVLDMAHYIAGFSSATNGTVQDNGDGTFNYIPDGNFFGEDSFTYTVCSDLCPNICVEETVSIRVAEQESCVIPTAFTPNDDGVNDTFVVPCLNTGLVAELIVFNRWGDEVYRNPIYQNEWGGTYKSDNLPTGTYFYVLEYEERGIETVRGYVYLQRE